MTTSTTFNAEHGDIWRDKNGAYCVILYSNDPTVLCQRLSLFGEVQNLLVGVYKFKASKRYKLVALDNSVLEIVCA